MTGAADLALADLTITAARERVVDFTVPFLQTGITVLYCTHTHTNSSVEFFNFDGLYQCFYIDAKIEDRRPPLFSSDTCV